jgi:hypothetical protein
MVLQHAKYFGHVTLITASQPVTSGTVPERRVAELVEAGVQLVTHGPKREDGMLVRVLGPSAAALQSVRWAAGFGNKEALHETLAGLPIAVTASLDRADEIAATVNPETLLGPVGFVTIGGYGDACRGLSWKWMEGLWTLEPPLWDILQVAHGPLQTFWERDMTLIALVEDSSSVDPLIARLRRVLHPNRHRLLCLKATTPGALALFEHGAALDRLMIGALESRPRDLGNWPAKGADEPLYGLTDPLE